MFSNAAAACMAKFPSGRKLPSENLRMSLPPSAPASVSAALPTPVFRDQPFAAIEVKAKLVKPFVPSYAVPHCGAHSAVPLANQVVGLSPMQDDGSCDTWASSPFHEI